MNKGYTSEKGSAATGPIRHQTLQPLGQGKHGSDQTPIKGMFPIDLVSYVPEATSTNQIIDLAGHLVQVGNVILFDAGPLLGHEVAVTEVIDANSFKLGNPQDAPITAADTFRILSPKSVQVDANGNFVVSQGPIQFIEDAVNEEVEIDTAVPANNKPLPAGLYIQKDGVIYPVTKDTTTPSNTLAIPVEIVGTVGQEITITAGDINVQTSHLGANADSMRIGNGTNELGINASLEALTHDADALAQLVLLVAKDFATETTLATRATEVTSAAILAKIIAAPATEAKQDTAITALGALLTELDKKADLTETQPVSAAALPLPAGASTEVTLAAILAKIIAAPSTEAKQDTAITALGALLTELDKKADLTETQPVSAAALPLPTGAATEATLNAIANIDFATENTLSNLVSTDFATEITLNNLLDEVRRLETGIVIPLIDVASTPIPALSSNPLEIIASTTGDPIREIQTIEDVGEYLGLYIGAVGVETLICALPIAGGTVKVDIAPGNRLSIKHLKESIIDTDTFFTANLMR